MQGIFLCLLVGYVAAQPYYKLRQEHYQAQFQPAGQISQQQYQMNSVQQHNSEQPPSSSVITNQSQDQYFNQHATPNAVSGTPLSINNGGTPQSASSVLTFPSASPAQQFPSSTNHRKPVEQARPPPMLVSQSSQGTRYGEPSQQPHINQGQYIFARPRPTVTRPILQRTTSHPAFAEDEHQNRFSSLADAATVFNKFNAKLFNIIAGSLPQRNIVYSPISLQLLLAFVYTGASGQTARQLQSALSLPATAQSTQKIFNNLLQTLSNSGSTQLVMANKMYHSQRLTVHPDMQRSAHYFDCAIEPTDFGLSQAAAAAINNWVAQKTQNIITQLVAPQELDAQTQAMLISAIYFKAKWAKEFSTSDTQQQDFHVWGERSVSVNMMFNDDTYRYGEFPELDADGLEMPYENSNMSMLILLPRKVNGLAAMEQRLQGVDLNGLTARMKMETVTLRIPKFRVEFELDVQEPLKRLGVTDLFSERAELKGFFASQSVGVSQVQHKAYLDVNEAGSEAAAASFIKLIPLSLPSRIVDFTVDHPFMFAIRSPQAVFFIGHVVDIQ